MHDCHYDNAGPYSRGVCGVHPFCSKKKNYKHYKKTIGFVMCFNKPNKNLVEFTRNMKTRYVSQDNMETCHVYAFS